MQLFHLYPSCQNTEYLFEKFNKRITKNQVLKEREVLVFATEQCQPLLVITQCLKLSLLGFKQI